MLSFLLLALYDAFNVWQEPMAFYRGAAFYLELPLLFFAWLLLYLPHRSFWKSLLGVFLLLALYMAHDAFAWVIARQE